MSSEEHQTTAVITDTVAEMVCDKCASRLNVTNFETFSKIACAQCGAELTVPGKLGGFLLTGLLGRGGMGAVFRGRDEALNRQVAIKVLLRSLGADEAFVATFRREAQAAAALNHPNIVQIYSFGVEKGQPYIVMELLTGGGLDGMIAKKEALEQAVVLQIGIDVAEGLNEANAIGLIHGDIKPENILRDSNGVAKVLDFGLAHFQGSSQPDGIWGTPYYIAPEKVKRLPHDARSDIYSLGATLFHALTGRPPFEGKTPVDVVKARLGNMPPRPNSLRPDIDPEIESIILRMLEPEPAKRYPNYASLISDMRRVLVRIRPTAGASMKTLKKGGKIVLTRMKPVVPRSSSEELSISGNTLSGRQEASEENAPGGIFDLGGLPPVAKGDRVKMLKKIAMWTGIGLGAAVLVTAIVIGILKFGTMSAEKEALQRHYGYMAKMRATGSAAAREFGTLASNATLKVAAAQNVYQAAVKQADDIRNGMTGLNTDITTGFNNLEINGDKLKTSLELMATNLVQIVELKDKALAQSTAMMATNAMVATNVDLRATGELQISQAVVEVSGMLVTARELFRPMDDAVEKIAKAKAQVTDFVPRFERARAAVAEEERKLAAKRAEEEERQRKEQAAKQAEEERQQKIQEEIDQVKTVRAELLSEVRMNKFSDAKETFTTRLRGLTAPGAIKARKAGEERFDLLIELKRFFISAINKEAEASPAGYRYGWLIGGIGARDILGATAEKIEVKGVGAVEWEKVPVAQTLRFIKHYLKEIEPEDSRVHGRMLLAAAVYCYENAAGDNRAGALGMASGYVTDAINRDARLMDKARELMPDLP